MAVVSGARGRHVGHGCCIEAESFNDNCVTQEIGGKGKKPIFRTFAVGTEVDRSSPGSTWCSLGYVRRFSGVEKLMVSPAAGRVKSATMKRCHDDKKQCRSLKVAAARLTGNDSKTLVDAVLVE